MSQAALVTCRMGKRLQRAFFARDTIDVARDLLGKNLVHQLRDGTRLRGRILETEAYLGSEDPAAHSFGGRRTPRTEPMFGDPGLSYVYFIYGIYFCFNVVTAERGVPEAVLIRAVEIDPQHHTVANGPGKLCIALKLGRAQNALDMTSSEELWIEDAPSLADSEIIEGARVGIGDLHDAVHWPLRFGVKGHAGLSPAKFTPWLP